MENDRLLQNFIKAAQEYQSLTPSTVSVIDGPPTPLQFSKLVASNRPVLFNGKYVDIGLTFYDLILYLVSLLAVVFFYFL